MMDTSFTYWRDGSHYLGFLDEYPEYQTQGDTLEDLQDHLLDLHQDLTAGLIPTI